MKLPPNAFPENVDDVGKNHVIHGNTAQKGDATTWHARAPYRRGISASAWISQTPSVPFTATSITSEPVPSDRTAWRE